MEVMATRMGLEPTTSAVTGRRSNQLSYQAITTLSSKTNGGNNRARTYDPLLVRQMLSQLSYAPILLYHLFATARVIITAFSLFVNRFLKIFSKKILESRKKYFHTPKCGIFAKNNH